MKKKRSVGTQGIGDRLSAGIGYIILPTDRSRQQFIVQCMNTTTVSILTENSEYLTNVPIDPFVLQQIEWPDEDANEGVYGSVVVWVNIPVHNKPVVVATLNRRDIPSALFEGQFKLNKAFDENFVEITGDAKKGQLAVNVKGGSGRVDVTVVNEDQTSQLNVHVKGKINVQATDDVEVKSSKIIYVYGKDKQQLGEGTEPLALGQTLKELFDDFIDEVGNITTSTAIGQMPILNKAQIEAFKNRTEEILSKKSFTD